MARAPRQDAEPGRAGRGHGSDRRALVLQWIWPPLLLYLLAFALRLPEMTTIPAITDETDELLWSLAIFRGEHWPPTASDAYIGPLANYATAASYALFGSSLASGRAAAIALGALIAPATWALARAVGHARRQAGEGRRAGEAEEGGGPWGGGASDQGAGILAGVVTAVAFGPVVISHIAWSHGGAPAWLALALAGLVAAGAARTARRRAAAALAGGICGGLAVGAHPTVLAFAPGVAAGWWLWGRGRAGDRAGGGRRPDPAVGDRLPAQPDDSRPRDRVGPKAQVLAWTILGLAIGYSPGLVVLARRGLAPFRASAEGQDYVGVDLPRWPLGIAAWLDGLLRNLVGPPVIAIDDPRLWLGAALVAAVLAWAWWNGQRFLGVVLLSGALVLPLIVRPDKFASLTGLRYSAPGLPILAAAVALAAVDVLAAELPWLAGRPARGAVSTDGREIGGRKDRRKSQPILAGAVLVGLLAIAAYAPIATFRFYGETRRGGVTSAPVLAVVDGLASGASRRDVLFVDNAFDTKLIGGGEVGRAIEAMLTLRGIAYTPAKEDKIRWFLANADGARYDLVLAGDTADAIGSEFAIEPVRVVPVVAGQVSRSGDRWGWYRFEGR